MRRSTEVLIGELASGLRPVRRLRSPVVRASAWTAALLATSAAAIALFGDVRAFLAMTSTPVERLAWLAALGTGITAVLAAAQVAVPDRSRWWAAAPLPFLAMWLALSGAGCWGLDPRSQGHSDHCFWFVLAAGLPISALLFWRLRRAAPLQPLLVSVCGALGAAGFAAALLQFFHPFPITWFDLLAHLAAAAVILIAGTVGGKQWVATPE